MNPRDSEKSPALRRIEADADNPSEAVLFVYLKTVFHKKLKYIFQSLIPTWQTKLKNQIDYAIFLMAAGFSLIRET